MKLKYIFLFLFTFSYFACSNESSDIKNISVFASGLCNKNGVSFDRIVVEAKKASLGDVLNVLESSQCFDSATRELLISDGVQNVGHDGVIYKKWKLSMYDEKINGFKLRLGLEQHSFVFPMLSNASEKYSCPDNMATSGSNVIFIADSNLKIVEAWSCGSMGCSYEYLYTESVSEDVKRLC